MLEIKLFCGQFERKKDHKRGDIILSISIAFSLDTCIPKMPPNNKYKRPQNTFSQKKKFSPSVPQEFKKYGIKDCRVCLVPLTKFVAAEYGITDLPRAIKVAIRTGSCSGAIARTFKNSSEYHIRSLTSHVTPPPQPCKIKAYLPFTKDLQKPLQCIQNGFKVHYGHMSKTESDKYTPNISYPCTEIPQTFRLDTDLKELEKYFRKCKVVIDKKDCIPCHFLLETPKEASVPSPATPVKRKRMNFEVYEETTTNLQNSIFNQKQNFSQEKSINFDKICINFNNNNNPSYLSQRQDRLNFTHPMKRNERINGKNGTMKYSTITDQNKTLRNGDRNELSIPSRIDSENGTLSQKKCVQDIQGSSIDFDKICETSEPEKQNKPLNLNNRCKTGKKRKLEDIYTPVKNQNKTLRNELYVSDSTIGASNTGNTLDHENCVLLEQYSLSDFDKNSEAHFGNGDMSQSEYTEPLQKQKSIDLYNKHNKEQEEEKVNDNDNSEDKVKENFTPLRVQTEHDGFDKYLWLQNKSNEATKQTSRVIDQTESSQKDQEDSVFAMEVTNNKGDVLNHEKCVKQQQELYSVDFDNSSETDDVDDMFVDDDQAIKSQQVKDLVTLSNVCNKEKAIYEEKTQSESDEHFYLEDRNNDNMECNKPVVDDSKLPEDKQGDSALMIDETGNEDEDFSQKSWVLKQKDHAVNSVNSPKNDNVGETFVGTDQSTELQQKSIDLNNGYSKEKDEELNSTPQDARHFDELVDSFCLNNSNNEHNEENDSTVNENKTLQNEHVSVGNADDEKHDVLSEERWIHPLQDYKTDFDNNKDVDGTFLNSDRCIESQQGQKLTDLTYLYNKEKIGELIIPIYDIRKQSKFDEYFSLEDSVFIINNDNIINNDSQDEQGEIIIKEIDISNQIDLHKEYSMENIKQLISPMQVTRKHAELDERFYSGNRNNEVQEEKGPVIDLNKILQEDQDNPVYTVVRTCEKCDVLNHKTCVQQEENSPDNLSENGTSETCVDGDHCAKSQNKRELISLGNDSNEVVSLIMPVNDEKKQAESDEHFCSNNEIMEESELSVNVNKVPQEEKENSVPVVDISDECGGAFSQETCVQREPAMNSSQNDEKTEIFPHSEQGMESDLEQGTVALNNDCNKENINELILPEYNARKQAEFQDQPYLEDKNDEGSPAEAKNKTLQFGQQHSITDETYERSNVSGQRECNKKRHKYRMNVNSSSENDGVNEIFHDNDDSECTDSEQKQKSVDLEDDCETQRSENRINEYTERNDYAVDENKVSQDEQEDSASVTDVTDEKDDALIENNQCNDSQHSEEPAGMSYPYNKEKTKELSKPLDDTGKQVEYDEHFHLENRNHAIVEKENRILDQNKTFQDNKDDSIPTIAITGGREDVLSEEMYIQQQEEYSTHFDDQSQQIQKSIDCNETEVNEQAISLLVGRKFAKFEELICFENKNEEDIIENRGIICQNKVSHDDQDDSLSVTDSVEEESPNQQKLEASVHLMDTSGISDDDCERSEGRNYPMRDERKQNKNDEYLFKNKTVENSCTKDHYNTTQDNEEGRLLNIFRPYAMPVIGTSNKEQVYKPSVVLDNLFDASDAFGDSLENSEAAEENGNVDNDSNEGKADNEDFNKEPTEMNNSSNEAKSKNEDCNAESVKMSNNSSEAKTVISKSQSTVQYEDISDDEETSSSKKNHSQELKSIDPSVVLRILTSDKNFAIDKSVSSDLINSNITKHNEKANVVSDSEGQNVSDIATEKLPETQTNLNNKFVSTGKTGEALPCQEKLLNKKSRKRVKKSTKVNKLTEKSQTKQANEKSDKPITVEAILNRSFSNVSNSEKCEEKGSFLVLNARSAKPQKRKRSVENCDYGRVIEKFGNFLKKSYENPEFPGTVDISAKGSIECPFD